MVELGSPVKPTASILACERLKSNTVKYVERIMPFAETPSAARLKHGCTHAEESRLRPGNNSTASPSWTRRPCPALCVEALAYPRRTMSQSSALILEGDLRPVRYDHQPFVPGPARNSKSEQVSVRHHCRRMMGLLLKDGVSSDPVRSLALSCSNRPKIVRDQRHSKAGISACC
jgi:hypothetical protein